MSIRQGDLGWFDKFSSAIDPEFCDAATTICSLVTAYRLPDTLFTGARVTVDIAIFQKVANPSKDWVEVKTIELANQKRFFMSNYFVENPSHIIGQLDSYSVWLQKEKRERTGLKCTGTMQEVIQRLPALIKKIHPVKCDRK